MRIRRSIAIGWPRYSVELGRHLGLPVEDLAALQRGGYLHDIGKIGIPDALLLKPAKLTPAEFELMKQHTVIGDRLCGELRSLKLVRQIVRHHHERFDGSGYPDGLRGDEIPLLAQIVGIADLYDAMTTDRPYRRALTQDEAFDALVDEAARGQRRPDLVELFISLARDGEFVRALQPWSRGSGPDSIHIAAAAPAGPRFTNSASQSEPEGVARIGAGL